MCITRILTCSLILLSVGTDAQVVAPAAVVPSGGHGAAGQVMLDWSMGQTVSATFIGGTLLTTGVLQPDASLQRIAIRVLLDGAWRNTQGLMVDSLRAKGLLPLDEPYTALGFSLSGATSCAPSVFAVVGDDAIIDWVVVELRSALNPAAVLEARAGLVQRDGDIVAIDGTSPMTFLRPLAAFHVSVRHRNHLGVMSALTVLPTAGVVELDLSLATTAVFGVDARKIIGGRALLWSGNVLPDDQVKYTGGNNDRDPILTLIGGTVPTNVATGYRREDVNLDGVVKYTGSNNDRDPVLSTVGGVVPTNVRSEQLP
jgi:hypothetical protein